jgi:hypothetical protein
MNGGEASTADKAEREAFLREYVQAYEAFERDDPEGWADMQAEARLWDCTLMDGLHDQPWEPLPPA